jgi:hypothetical protein
MRISILASSILILAVQSSNLNAMSNEACAERIRLTSTGSLKYWIDVPTKNEPPARSTPEGESEIEMEKATRFLVTAFKQDIEITEKDLAAIKSIIDNFRPEVTINQRTRSQIDSSVKELLTGDSVSDSEYNQKVLDHLGLRTKLNLKNGN